MAISTSMENVHRFTLYTLVDITQTDVTKNYDGQDLERNQQRNWESVIQTISLLAQPVLLEKPTSGMIDLSSMEFGEIHQGEQRVWSMTFGVEHADVFASEHGATGRLENMFDQVPVIAGLSETARFLIPIFFTSGTIKNIYFIHWVK